MSIEKYPKDLAVSLQDFETSGWKEAITPINKNYPERWTALSSAASAAIKQNQLKHGKVLGLLADACSMMLSPSSPNEPFKPFAVFGDRRSFIPDDLLDTDIMFFVDIVDAVDDHLLKARLSDLLWLKSKPRHTDFALKAIDAYYCIPLDTNTWIDGGQECWERALSLTRMLKNKAGDRLQLLEASILSAFNDADHTHNFFILWLAELLRSNKLALNCRVEVVKKLEEMAEKFDGENEHYKSRLYFEEAAKWYHNVDKVKEAAMTVAVAEGWVKEAIARIASESPSHAVAAHFYENAIQTYRTIPRTERSTHRVDERIAQLRAELNKSGEKSLEEMALIQSSSIDIADLVEIARQSVAGKSLQESLLNFANLSRGVNVENLRNNVLKRMREHPLSTLFSSTTMSHDGRVIAKRKGMSFGKDLTDEDEKNIQAEMIKDYKLQVDLVVLGYILPALEVLLLEHRLQERVFVELARSSSIIPKGRAGLFGKALFSGYEGDFVTALHLLIPQVEHMVRMHLKQAGAQTTNIDKDGIQNENGLSTLIELPEAVQLFGENFSFEMKALFCDAVGPNLRNMLAHGLLDEDDCNSSSSIYAWWWALRITINAWWSSANAAAVQQEVNNEQSAAAEPIKEQGES